ADVLVHGATFTHENRQLADAYFHSTTTQAAQLAKKGHVKQLVLTHISSRYQPDDWQTYSMRHRKFFRRHNSPTTFLNWKSKPQNKERFQSAFNHDETSPGEAWNDANIA